MQYDKGNLTPVQSVEADTLHASGSADIHITPDGRFLYASNRLKGDGIAIFSIDPANGQLTKVGYQLTGVHPRNFVTLPTASFCFAPVGTVMLCRLRNRQAKRLVERYGKRYPGKQAQVCLKFTNR